MTVDSVEPKQKLHCTISKAVTKTSPMQRNCQAEEEEEGEEGEEEAEGEEARAHIFLDSVFHDALWCYLGGCSSMKGQCLIKLYNETTGIEALRPLNTCTLQSAGVS